MKGPIARSLIKSPREPKEALAHTVHGIGISLLLVSSLSLAAILSSQIDGGASGILEFLLMTIAGIAGMGLPAIGVSVFYEVKIGPKFLRERPDWAPYHGLALSGEETYRRYVVESFLKDAKERIGLKAYEAQDGYWKDGGWVRKPRPFEPDDYEAISRWEEILREQGRKLTEEAIHGYLETQELASRQKALEASRRQIGKSRKELVM